MAPARRSSLRVISAKIPSPTSSASITLNPRTPAATGMMSLWLQQRRAARPARGRPAPRTGNPCAAPAGRDAARRRRCGAAPGSRGSSPRIGKLRAVVRNARTGARSTRSSFTSPGAAEYATMRPLRPADRSGWTGLIDHLHVEHRAQPLRIRVRQVQQQHLVGQMPRQGLVQPLVALLVVELEEVQRSQRSRPTPTRANKPSRTAASLL